MDQRIAVVGATGAVGRVMLDILHERGATDVKAVASARSAGRRIAYGSGELVVEELAPDVFEGVDLAIFDTPDEVSLEWAPVAVQRGAVVVDNSAAWRMDPEVPLIVPEINPEAVLSHKGIIASPNCTTIGILLPLAALHRSFTVRSAVASSYQATSGAGQPGVEELRLQVDKVGSDIDPLAHGDIRTFPEPQVFAAPIAFNVVPVVGSLKSDGFTGEEQKIVSESRKIMGIEDLDITATCVRVPTVVGHGASVLSWFESPVSNGAVSEALEAAPGIEVVEVATPLLAAGRDAVYVSRVRVDETLGRVWYFSASDNLRKGAALNAVQVAELLSR